MNNENKIPEWWAVCQNENCELAETCLRQQTCRNMPHDIVKWTSIMPQAQKGCDCKYFQKYEKVTMARGLNNIYNNVRARRARSDIRETLTAELGSKGTYYRYKDGEKVIGPELQKTIIDIVHRFAPDAEVHFDVEFEDYDYTKTVPRRTGQANG